MCEEFFKLRREKIVEQEVKYYTENLALAVTSMELLYKEEDLNERNVCKKVAQEAIDYFTDHHDEIKEFSALVERLEHLIMLAKNQMEKC